MTLVPPPAGLDATDGYLSKLLSTNPHSGPSVAPHFSPTSVSASFYILKFENTEDRADQGRIDSLNRKS